MAAPVEKDANVYVNESSDSKIFTIAVNSALQAARQAGFGCVYRDFLAPLSHSDSARQ